jgi:hypothetical protein
LGLTKLFIGTPFDGSEANISLVYYFARDRVDDIGMLRSDLVEPEIETGTRLAPANETKTRSEVIHSYSYQRIRSEKSRLTMMHDT